MLPKVLEQAGEKRCLVSSLTHVKEEDNPCLDSSGNWSGGQEDKVESNLQVHPVPHLPHRRRNHRLSSRSPTRSPFRPYARFAAESWMREV